jgi:hypothetical protein
MDEITVEHIKPIMDLPKTDRRLRQASDMVKLNTLQQLACEGPEEATVLLEKCNMESMESITCSYACLIYEGLAIHLVDYKLFCLKAATVENFGLDDQGNFLKEVEDAVDAHIIEFGLVEWINATIDGWNITTLSDQLSTFSTCELAGFCDNLDDNCCEERSARAKQYRQAINTAYEKASLADQKKFSLTMTSFEIISA